MSDAERLAYRLGQEAQAAYQDWLDTFLIPASDAPAEQVRTNFQPIEQYIKEGIDVGEPEEDRPEGYPRFN